MAGEEESKLTTTLARCAKSEHAAFVAVQETKVDQSYSDDKVTLPGYVVAARMDRPCPGPGAQEAPEEAAERFSKGGQGGEV